jgi:hypothetical protein
MTRCWLACWILLGLLPAGPACADDAAIFGVGGSVSPILEHPSIRMTAEFVHAWLFADSVEVECVFFLQNDGPDTSVTMGFPNRSGGAGVEDIVSFHRFQSFVDGDSVSTEIRRDAEHQSYGDYACWYTKTVAFAAGQTRCIRESYSASPGSTSLGGVWFDYILWSGATWAGTIGVADIVVTVDSAIPAVSWLRVRPAGFRRSANEFRWHFTDFEPHRGSDGEIIHIEWR